MIIGDDNIFREYVTVNRATVQGGGITSIGNKNFLMAYVHVAHDCQIGDNVILANSTQLAGHVRVENCVVIGGVSALHPFVTVGRNAYIAGMTRVTHDVPPYMKVVGYDQTVRGTNAEGLRRWKFPATSITALRTAARLLYARRAGRPPARPATALTEIESNGLMHDEHVCYLVAFLRRKLACGGFGRVREQHRNDVDADRHAHQLEHTHADIDSDRDPDVDADRHVHRHGHTHADVVTYRDPDVDTHRDESADSHNDALANKYIIADRAATAEAPCEMNRVLFSIQLPPFGNLLLKKKLAYNALYRFSVCHVS